MTATADITVANLGNALTISNAALRFSPPVQAEEEAGGSGFLGLLFKPPSRAAATTQQAQRGLRTVWVANGDDLKAVEIETGETDGIRTEIVTGALAQGDRVVVDMVTQ